jgi:hypothetical protein
MDPVTRAIAPPGVVVSAFDFQSRYDGALRTYGFGPLRGLKVRGYGAVFCPQITQISQMAGLARQDSHG